MTKREAKIEAYREASAVLSAHVGDYDGDEKVVDALSELADTLLRRARLLTRNSRQSAQQVRPHPERRV